MSRTSADLKLEDQVRKSFSLKSVPSFAGRPIEEMLDYWYGRSFDGLTPDIMKAGVTSTTAGYVVDVSAPTVWVWAANGQSKVAAWTSIPKTTYDANAWMVETAEADTTVSGIAKDSGNLPSDTSSSLERAANGVKIIPSATSVTLAAEIEGRVGNAPAGDIWPYTKQSKGDSFVRGMDKHLLGDPTTVAGNNLESLLRGASSKTEESSDLTAGDADIYGFDRSSATTYDAYVDRNAGTTATLTLTMIDLIFQNLRPYEEPNLIITGLDTQRRLAGLLQAQEIYTVKNVQFDVNGIRTARGAEAGFEVASYLGVPIIGDGNMRQASGGISDILAMNTKYVALQTAVPIVYQETSDPFINNGFKRRMLWLYVGELQMTRFNTLGKVTFLK